LPTTEGFQKSRKVDILSFRNAGVIAIQWHQTINLEIAVEAGDMPEWGQVAAVKRWVGFHLTSHPACPELLCSILSNDHIPLAIKFKNTTR
jgi:hypothetical protein